MAATNPTPPSALSADALIEDWTRALRAEHRSPCTIKSYSTAVRQLAAYGVDKGRGDALTTYDKRLIRDFLAYIIETRSPATAQTRYDAISSCYRWLVDEEELEAEASPMRLVKRPKAPEPVTPVLSLDQVRRLLAVCNRHTLRGARDRALMVLMLDTGVRVGGLIGAEMCDLDLDSQHLTVLLKGSKRPHRLPFGDRAATEVARYLRLRRTSPLAAEQWLWLGPRGPLTESGVEQLLIEHAKAAQLGIHVHPHMFRHTFAHLWKAGEGKDDDLIEIAGWSGPKQLARYGRDPTAAAGRCGPPSA